MSLYMAWFAVCQHIFLGCPYEEVVSLMACIFTAWTVIMIALVPYFITRRLTK